MVRRRERPSLTATHRTLQAAEPHGKPLGSVRDAREAAKRGQLAKQAAARSQPRPPTQAIYALQDGCGLAASKDLAAFLYALRSGVVASACSVGALGFHQSGSAITASTGGGASSLLCVAMGWGCGPQTLGKCKESDRHCCGHLGNRKAAGARALAVPVPLHTAARRLSPPPLDRI